MKKILLAIVIVLVTPALLWSAPFLICDPQAGVAYYKLTGPSWVPTSSIAQPDGSAKVDVAASTVGSNAITIAACTADAVWGELCSTSVPFAFVRPAPPVGIKNIRLFP